MDTNDFELFLQLDDVSGDRKEKNNQMLEDYRRDNSTENTEVDLDDYDADKDMSHSFEELPEDYLFEDEDGWVDPDAEETEEVEDTEEDAEGEETEEEGEAEGTEEDAPEYEEVEAYDVDYDTLITLPDGRDITIEELAGGYLTGSDLVNRENDLGERVKEFEARVAGMQNVLELSELEADKVINDYESFDWDTLAAQDPQAYVENKRFLERYQARKQELIAAQQRLQAEKEAKEQELYKEQCVECVNVLKKAIPNWDEPLYQSLMQYAIDLGASEEEVLKENRPSIFIALHKAYQFDKGRDKVMAKIKRPGAPKKVVRPGVKNPVSDAEAGKRAKAAQAYAKGKMSQEDAFRFLED